MTMGRVKIGAWPEPAPIWVGLVVGLFGLGLGRILVHLTHPALGIYVVCYFVNVSPNIMSQLILSKGVGG